ncbi:Cubulin 2 [Carabus blaptoides fortunei]
MLPWLITLVVYVYGCSGFIEIVTEHGTESHEFRLTCRSLNSYIAVMEAKFTPGSFEEDMQVNLTSQQQQQQLEEEYEVRLALNTRCSGRNHCSFILHQDQPGSEFWGSGEIYLKYACMPDGQLTRFCNANVTIPEGGGVGAQGFISTPAYPNYYVGHAECRWRIIAPQYQRVEVTLLDVALSGADTKSKQCEDELIVSDEQSDLVNTCQQKEIPHIVLSASNTVDIRVTGRTGSLVPKRGILLYYRALECPTPGAPTDGYLVHRNTTAALYMCCVGYVFPDTLQRTRTLTCLQNAWDTTLPAECINLQNGTRTTTDQVKDRKNKMSDESHLIDVVIPSIIIAGLLLGNAIVVFIIYKYRKRKNVDILEEELDTIVADPTIVP